MAKRDASELIATNAPNIALGIVVLGVGVWLMSRNSGSTDDAFRACAKGPGRTLSDPAIAALVSRIREAFYGELVTEDEASAIQAISRVGSQSDFCALVVAFGTWAPITQTDRDLFQAVRAFVSAGDIDDLNAVLASKGVKTFL